jgi:anti-anti-sigma factor
MGVRAVDERLSIRETRDGGIRRLAVSGDLDAGAEPVLATALSATLDGTVGLLTVDVSGVPFISATALLEIAAAAEVVPVQLTGANRSVCRVAAILGLSHLVTIEIAAVSAA